ncbi:GNAT family N-acetyltransferase [Actinoplanes solisilvae]|uniref:GNAT family N-acetyltransferase n=1 Tax=Actinoplanes solisilvae TaxID=2486853 RepID=UPI001F0C6F88|nr:GNAT family N-acetyltransferase [Actinoplanes solisilvae]
MIVRPRVDDDLDRCVEALRLVHDADSYPLNWPESPRAWLEAADAAWVAELDGELVGHAAVMGHELCRLFVVPAARRLPLSVGRALVEQVRAHVAGALTLNVVDEQRSGAVAFYEATGWRFTHTTDAAFTRPDGGPVRLRHYELPDGLR